jgi:hypothetical protein
MRKGVSFFIRRSTLVRAGVAALFLICLTVGYGLVGGGAGDGAGETVGGGAEEIAGEIAGVGDGEIGGVETAGGVEAVRAEAGGASGEAGGASGETGGATDDGGGTGSASDVSGWETAAEREFYEGYRMERDRLRSEQIQILKEMAGSGLYEDDRQREVQDRMLRIAEEREQELLIESALTAMGLNPCAVVVQWDNALVIARSSVTQTLDTRQIIETAARISGKAPENVILIPGR